MHMRRFAESTRDLLEEVAELPMVGRTRDEFLNRVNALLDAKSAVVVAVHQLGQEFTEFVNWAVPAGEIRTDIRPLLRNTFLEM